ncbi:conserved Plasmodium protein, unknown function [Plasmodium ovale]|uniref:Uncharacterized protein n=2 Tax=Plasmodium ovale TaxID=36330 RepID=A0A1C3KM86_PLAOA|nr:conserved Plasmodium protein, unknown function [Plasmodium ovale]
MFVMNTSRKNLCRVKKLIRVHGIITSNKFCNNESFIFNFENVENLKKIKEPITEPSFSQTDVERRRNDIYINSLDKYRVKKVRKVLTLVKKKLKNYEHIPLNRHFFIFYKNIDCLLEEEVIHILYLALKNRQCHSHTGKSNDIDNGFTTDSNPSQGGGISGGKADVMTHNYTVDDISDHLFPWENETKEGISGCTMRENFELISGKTVNNSHLYGENKGEDVQRHILRTEVEVEGHAENDIAHTNTEGINKPISVDYVRSLLFRLMELLRGEKAVCNLSLVDMYKLSYCMRYYNADNGKSNFMPLYVCSFLRREIDIIYRNDDNHEIKQSEQLDILLLLLAMQRRSLKGPFFSLLYDYIFAILKSGLFRLSCKNICLLLHVRNFDRSKYDSFFFLLFHKKEKEKKRYMTLTDINYLLFYQMKNSVMIKDPSFQYEMMDKILTSSHTNTMEVVPNMQLISLLLLHYDFSKKVFNGIYEKYVEVVYNMYSYLISLMNRFLQKADSKGKRADIQLMLSFSLALYIIRNNLYLSEEFYLYLFSLICNYAHTLTTNEYIMVLNLVYYCDYKNEVYYRRNPLYAERKKCLYVYDNMEEGREFHYSPFDPKHISVHIYKHIKRAYEYKEGKNHPCSFLSVERYEGNASTMIIALKNGTSQKREETHSFFPLQQCNAGYKIREPPSMEATPRIYEIQTEKYPTHNTWQGESKTKKNKSHYMHILDILISLRNDNADDNLFDYLSSLFRDNIWKFNLHIFDIDKILHTYSLLKLRKNCIPLSILEIIERVKKNFVSNKKNCVNKESYIFHSMCSILLSYAELNLWNVFELVLFEREILENINQVNINSILILLQYFILKGSNESLNIHAITLLVLQYIKKKYFTETWDVSEDTSVLNEMRNDKMYDFVRMYLRGDNCKGTIKKENIHTEYSREMYPSRSDTRSVLSKRYEEGNYVANFSFKKRDENDLYEFLLLRLVFINIATHSSLFYDNFRYHYREEEIFRQLINSFNKIVLHLKNDFTDVLNISLYDTNYNSNRNRCEKDDTHCTVIEQTYHKKCHILSKRKFLLLINYFHFIFKHSLIFIAKDTTFIESMTMQYHFVKKFKSLYYNFKYSFIYRHLILSLIHNIKRRNCLRINCELFDTKNDSPWRKEQMIVNEYVQVIKHFSNLCFNENIKDNTFYAYLSKNSIKYCKNREECKYEIFFNQSIVYTLSNYKIENVYTNFPFFNYIIPMIIETKNLSVAVQTVFNPKEDLDSYMAQFYLMEKLLKNYNYELILVKRTCSERD